MTLRSRLVSVLLFLGAFMVVPLGFQYWDYLELQEAYREFASEGGSSDADAKLAEKALEDLTELVREVGRALSSGEAIDAAGHQARLNRFLLAWRLFQTPVAENLAALPYAQHLLGDSDPTSSEAWDAALARVSTHKGSAWTEDPMALRKALAESLESAAAGGQASRRSFGRLKNVATTFRARLLGVDATSEDAPGAVFEARVRGTSKVFLLELIRRQQEEVFRIALLAGAGILLAVFFARALWNELIHPLQRLQGAMNNMAMSGSPSRVKVEGPREIKDVLGAYNRLLDTIAGETPAAAPGGDSCTRCNRETQKGDKYCPTCGFPLPGS